MPRPPQRANGEQLFPSLVSTSDTSERMEEKRESNKDTCLIQELERSRGSDEEIRRETWSSVNTRLPL